MRALTQWMSVAATTVVPQYHVMDLFGASRKVATEWTAAGFGAIGYDIQFGANCDICSKSGFQRLLEMGLAFLVCYLVRFFWFLYRRGTTVSICIFLDVCVLRNRSGM